MMNADPAELHNLRPALFFSACRCRGAGQDIRTTSILLVTLVTSSNHGESRVASEAKGVRMPAIGLFLLPIASNQTSPSALLISHISRSFPAETLPTFHLDHRLFVDTSSLLPNSDASLRRFTSILTLSHTPGTTYVGTTPSKDNQKEKGKSQAAAVSLERQPAGSTSSSTLVTIPSTHVESFTQLLGTKLQPHWAHRQSLVVDNGTALTLDHAEWTVRIGDLKTPTSRSVQATVTSNLRGMLVEISFNDASNIAVKGEGGDSTTQPEPQVQTRPGPVGKDDETLIRGFFDSLLEGTGLQMATSNTRALFRNTRAASHFHDKETTRAADWDLADLYMEMLRTPR